MSVRCCSRREFIQRSAYLACGGVLSLQALPALAIRPEALHYTTRSDNPDKTCGNCLSFIPARDPQAPGECYVLHGIPISPLGHCSEWALKKR